MSFTGNSNPSSSSNKNTGAKGENTGPNTSTTATSNVPALGILEEDDEFEEFPVEDWDETEENRLDIEQWEADWDDDNLDDEFALTLRRELERTMADTSFKTNAGNTPK